MSEKGNLYLIPSVIADSTQDKVIPPHVKNELKSIRHFLVENVRTARRYLSSLKIYDSIEPLDFKVLDKETKMDMMEGLFRPLMAGRHVGILSEAGCPGVADPGSLAVMYAHERGIKVIPLVGPSSVLLSLMASGLNGQRFAFHGYLPIDSKENSRAIKALERESKEKNQTQIIIETPYRNNALLGNLVKNLNPGSRLCLAVDVTGANEDIQTRSVKDWKHHQKTLPKLPTIFLFLG